MEEKTEIQVEDNKEKKNRKFEKLQEKINKLEEQIEKLQGDANHWKNEYYRAYADTQNLRKSLEKDHMEAMKYRSEGFLDELLPVLDSFYVVLKNEPDDEKLKNYLIGFQFIYKNLVSALESEGVKEISPQVGDKFDAKVMNAVETEETDGEDGLVTRIMTKGYKLHDRLVRPANVVVSAKHQEDEKKEEQENNENKFDA